MGTKSEVVSKFRNADLNIVLAPKRPKRGDKSGCSTQQFRTTGRCLEDDYAYNPPDSSGQKDEIKQYKIQVLPPEGSKVLVEPNLYFLKTVETNQDSHKVLSVTTRIHIISTGGDGPRRIDDFCDRALEHYKEVEGRKDDGARYLYSPVAFPGKETASKSSVLFKRYKLADDKTFASFFHPDKDALISLLDRFTSKTGKFAIPGYPQKLGILLDGPPGTGKTSLIKSMAHYLKRNIISIPLEKVETNQDLMDLVFDQAFTIKEDQWTYNLPFRKTIFVFEDIDAADKVVLKRSEAQAHKPEMEHPKIADCMTEIISQKLGTKSEKDVESYLSEIRQAMSFSKSDIKGKLNLAGLLNVLDGVIDCPDRVVIMTTNHPELLDPALIRPGRINKQMHLDLLKTQEALLMLEHYFPEIDSEHKTRLREIFPDGEISPAKLECLCAEYNSVQELVASLVGSKSTSLE